MDVQHYRKQSACFPQGQYQFALPPATRERSRSSASSPALGVVSTPRFPN